MGDAQEAPLVAALSFARLQWATRPPRCTTHSACRLASTPSRVTCAEHFQEFSSQAVSRERFCMQARTFAHSRALFLFLPAAWNCCWTEFALAMTWIQPVMLPHGSFAIASVWIPE